MRFRVWTRRCDICGVVATITRHISERPPSRIFCGRCGTEHPRAYSPPLQSAGRFIALPPWDDRVVG